VPRRGALAGDGAMSHPTSRPLVSVITPAYNVARFVPETIRSVQAQTFQDWEMVVADDASTDGTSDLVREAAAHDPRIVHLKLAGRSGAAGARNAAMDAARGRYIAFLDSDDLWLPEKLAIQLAYARETGAAFVFAEYRFIDEEGEEIGTPVRVPERVTYAHLLRNTIIGCLTVVLDRERTGELRMRALRQHEDLALWYSILRSGIVAHGLRQELAAYRIVRGSASRDKLRSAAHMWKVYREVERLPLPTAAMSFACYAWNALYKYRLHAPKDVVPALRF
jgi:teichuronic acid biosynthesis glycosyltransferase TuaG